MSENVDLSKVDLKLERKKYNANLTPEEVELKNKSFLHLKLYEDGFVDVEYSQEDGDIVQYSFGWFPITIVMPHFETGEKLINDLNKAKPFIDQLYSNLIGGIKEQDINSLVHEVCLDIIKIFQNYSESYFEGNISTYVTHLSEYFFFGCWPKTRSLDEAIAHVISIAPKDNPRINFESAKKNLTEIAYSNFINDPNKVGKVHIDGMVSVGLISKELFLS